MTTLFRRACSALLSFALIFSTLLSNTVLTFTPSAAASTTVAGVTPGKFEVSPSGAATYSIPIQVPPGIKGTEPKLTLNYNSQGGNGHLGLGFNLTGFPKIERCGKTIAQDGSRYKGVNYDSDDKFCLNGERLIALSGTYGANNTEYRTEKDSGARIYSYGTTCGNGPCYFKAKAAGGVESEFGNTADSRMEAIAIDSSGNTSVKSEVRVWALNKATDSNGNYTEISYTHESTGDYYPLEVKYTGNTSFSPKHKVTFTYGDRDDDTKRYHAGTIIEQTKRLTNIKTYADNNLIKDYRLSYDYSSMTKRSRLKSIEEWDAYLNHLPKTEFTWQEETSPDFSDNGKDLPNKIFYHGSDFASRTEGVLADFNGDGILDFSPASQWGSGGTAILDIYHGGHTTGNWFQDSGYDLADEIFFHGDGFNSRREAVLRDFNGDGLVDFARGWWEGYNNCNYKDSSYDVYHNNGSGFTEASYDLPDKIFYVLRSDVPERYFRIEGEVADFNGDGRADFTRGSNWDGGPSYYDVYHGNGSGFSDAGYDLPNKLFYHEEEDGCTDAEDYISRREGILADFNGDGILDFSTASDWDGGSANYDVYHGTGSGFVDAGYDLPNKIFYHGSDFKTRTEGVLADFNGDGILDFSTASDWDGGSSNYDVYHGTGSGFVDAGYDLPNKIFYHGSDFKTRTEGILADFNGDGILDFSTASGWDGGSANLDVYHGTGSGFVDAGYDLPNKIFYHGSDFKTRTEGVLVDINGDGILDFSTASEWDGGSSDYNIHELNLVPDLITKVTTGIGAEIEVTYEPLTDSSVYTKESNAEYPERDIQTPMYVVSQHKVKNTSFTTTEDINEPNVTNRGIANDSISSIKVSNATVKLYENTDYGGTEKTYTADKSNLGDDSFNDKVSSFKIDPTSSNWEVTFYEHGSYGGKSYTLDETVTYAYAYHYEGLKVDLERGSLGFHKTTVTDSQTQTKTVATYKQDYPFTGLLESQKVYSTATNKLISETTPTNKYIPEVSTVIGSCIPNDTISSIDFLDLAELTIYEHDKFGGASASYTNGDVASLGGLNDKMSSFKFVPNGNWQIVFYEDANYSGTSYLINKNGCTKFPSSGSSSKQATNVTYKIHTTSKVEKQYAENETLVTTYQTNYEYDGKQRLIRKDDLGDTSTSDDNIYICYDYPNNSGSDWWKNYAVTAEKTLNTDVHGWTGSGDTYRCNVNFGTWSSSTDLRLRQHTYDSKLNLSSQKLWNDTDSEWITTSFTYDSYGNLTEQTDPLSNTSTVTFDSTYHTYPTGKSSDGLSTSSTYEPKFGIQTARVDLNGNTVTQVSSFDGFGRITETKGINPDGNLVVLTKAEYATGENSKGLKTTIYTRPCWDTSCNWDANDKTAWHWTTEYQDSLGRTYKTESKGPTNNLITKTEFDSKGRVAKEYVPHYSDESSPDYTRYTYDNYGRVTQVTAPDGTISQMSYDVANYKTTGKSPDPRDAASSSNLVNSDTYTDAKGLTTKVVSPDGSESEYEYDRLGQQTKVIDPFDQQTTTSYNSLGQVTQTVDPERGTTTATYKDNGQVELLTDAKGQKIKFTYDSLGRETKKETYLNGNYPSTVETTINYTYGTSATNNNKGKLIEIEVDGIKTTEYKYDKTGKVTEEKVTLSDTDAGSQAFITEYTHTPLGVETVTHPDDSVTKYTYTAYGALQKIQHKESGGSFTDYATYSDLDALGNISQVTYGNGVVADYDFDDIGRLTDSSLTKSSTTLNDLDYAWNKANKILSITDKEDSDLTRYFSYDKSGQLTLADKAASNNIYDYDSAGNITGKIKTSLIADYPFTGNANDESGNANDGTVSGATLTTDRSSNSNSAYDFDGTDDYISVTLNDLKTDEWSISTWAKAEAFDTGAPFALRTSSGEGFWWHFQTDDTIDYRVKDSPNGEKIIDNVTMPTSMSTGTWHHHVITVSEDSVKHYIDGAQHYSWTPTFDPSDLGTNDLVLYIGRGTDSSSYSFDGSVDEVKVYKDALSAIEIQDLYEGTSITTESTYTYSSTKKHQLTEIAVAGETKTITFDATGNMTRKGNLYYSYDALGQLTKVELDGNSDGDLNDTEDVTINTFTYDQDGNRVSKIDYNESGNVETKSFYVTGGYEVTKVNIDGTASTIHTKSIGGVAVQTKTGTGVVAWQNYHNNGVLAASLASGTGLGGKLAYAGAKIKHLASHPKLTGYATVSLAGTLLLGLLTLVGWSIIRVAASESLLGRRRQQLAKQLRKLNIITAKTAKNLSQTVRTDWLSTAPFSKLTATAGTLVAVFVSLVMGVGTADALTAGTNGAGVPVANETLYMHTDHLGSTTVVTNTSGSVVNRIAYEPYGEIDQNNSTGNDTFRAKFTTKEYDNDAGLYYFGARYYDPEIQRFTTPDPADQFHSPYKYAGDPMTSVDPDGRWFWDDIAEWFENDFVNFWEEDFVNFFEENAASIVWGALIVGAIVLTIVCPPAGIIASSMILGGLLGGAAANNSWDPNAWDYTSGKTWAGIGIGAAVGAAGGVGIGVALAGGGAAAAIGLAAGMVIGGLSGGAGVNGTYAIWEWDWSSPKTWAGIFAGAAVGAACVGAGGALGPGWVAQVGGNALIGGVANAGLTATTIAITGGSNWEDVGWAALSGVLVGGAFGALGKGISGGINKGIGSQMDDLQHLQRNQVNAKLASSRSFSNASKLKGGASIKAFKSGTKSLDKANTIGVKMNKIKNSINLKIGIDREISKFVPVLFEPAGEASRVGAGLVISAF